MVLPKLVTREMVLFPMWPSLKTDSVKYHPLCSYRCKQMFSLLPISSSLTYLSPFFVNLSFSLFLILSLILSLYPWLKVCEESGHRLTSLSLLNTCTYSIIGAEALPKERAMYITALTGSCCYHNGQRNCLKCILVDTYIIIMYCYS